MEPPLHGVAASPPIRPRHDRYLSFSYSPPSSAGDELTEDDIFDTPAEPESSPPHPQPRHHHKHFGILAALPASETRSVFNHKASAAASVASSASSVASSASSTSSTSSARAIPSIHHRRPPARGKLMQQSAPVNVPVLARRRGAEYASEGEEEEEEGGEVQMLPPHEMVAARDSPVVACSVLEGVGRTLKGRDVRRVRNAVFRKTGFID